MRSVPNVPNTDWLEVYYDGQDYTSMPSTVTDKSGNGVTGTPNGGVGFDTEYKSFTFDGTDDYIRGTISGVTGDYIHSASLWIKLADADDIIFEISGATRAANSIIGLYVDADGTLAYYFYNNDTRYNTNLQIGQWYHVGLTYHGGGERRVYVNGVQATFKTSYGTLTNSLTLAGGTLTIGNQIDLVGNYFKGSIANFRLFNRALTGDEIWQLYAYQKEYFDVSPDVVTFKGGRLGIGTSEPRAVLDVQGSAVIDGIVGTSPTGGIIIPSGTTAQQPTGQVGMVRFNTSLNKLQVHDGTTWSTIGNTSATGGTVTYVGGYTIHTFTSSDNFVTTTGGAVEYLIVAGGGGGGSGGGGAGGMLTGTFVLPAGSYTITVGDGGSGGGGGAGGATTNPTSGTDSSALGYTTDGGGYGGGGSQNGRLGANGGSGGGHGYDKSTPTRTSGTPGQGNGGGRAGRPGLGGAGGGGGAGAVGADGFEIYGGNGGIGVQSSITGTATYYAGGGGGSLNQNNNTTYPRPSGQTYGGFGGTGGGGAGTTYGYTGGGTTVYAEDATANTGGGGGGTDPELNTGGDGGEGIVIIRYLS
jgi:hypothetical protein